MYARHISPRTLSFLLLLRQRAEQEKRRQLELSRVQLERARRQEALLMESRARIEQALERQRAAHKGRAMSAYALSWMQGALRHHHGEARRCEWAQVEAAAQVTVIAAQMERLREGLLLAIMRREAAERHEAEERRERARFRARRQEVSEEEAAGRRRWGAAPVRPARRRVVVGG